MGEYSRGGKTRRNNQACDHDLGCGEKYIPCGIVDEDSGQLYINFGSSFILLIIANIIQLKDVGGF
jgi:hypothetical protein